MLDPCGIPSGLALWGFFESGLLCILSAVFGTIYCYRLLYGVVLEESIYLWSRICFSCSGCIPLCYPHLELGFGKRGLGFLHCPLLCLDLVSVLALLYFSLIYQWMLRRFWQVRKNRGRWSWVGHDRMNARIYRCNKLRATVGVKYRRLCR